MSIWRWADWIESVSAENRITLGEGNSPVIRSRRIGPAAGLEHLFFKLETNNPAGSFKDRFAASAISHMRAAGKTRCLATSSGNTGSALAAYCAAAGIECHIAIVETAPDGKLRQMMAYGAHIFRVRRFGLDPQLTSATFETLRKLAQRDDSQLQISSVVYSPLGMSGVETISLELHEQLESADHVFCPAGGGGLCVAVARGYESLVRQSRSTAGPAVHCVQPEGNDTIAGPLRRGEARGQDVDCTTRISGLQVANVVDGHLAIEHCRRSGGTGHLIADDRTWHVQQRLAREEGIFSEPAGAIALAGALQAADEGIIDPDSTVVCLVTGSGFKDQDSVTRMLDGAQCPTIDLQQMEAEIAGR